MPNRKVETRGQIERLGRTYFPAALQPRIRGYEKPLPVNPDWISSFEDRGDQRPTDPVTPIIGRARQKVGENAAEIVKGLLDDPLFSKEYRPDWSNPVRTGATLAATVPFGIVKGAGRSIVQNALKAAEKHVGADAARLLSPQLEQMGEETLSRLIKHGGGPEWNSIADAVINDAPGVRTENVREIADAVQGTLPSAPPSASSPLWDRGGGANPIEALRRRDVPTADAREFLQNAGSETKEGVRFLSDPGAIEGGTDAVKELINERKMKSASSPVVDPRIAEAKSELLSRGVDPDVVPIIAPSYGREAEDFVKNLRSINPEGAREFGSGTVPSIRQHIGAPYINLGRTEAVKHGASPKRMLESASGQKFMHKGVPFSGGMFDDTATGIAENIKGSHWASRGIPGEEATTRVSRLLNDKTPVARQVLEGGTVQDIIPGNLTGFSEMSIKDPRRYGSPEIAHQMQPEHVIDTLLRNYDAHKGQFLADESNKVFAVDKGLGSLGDYQAQVHPMFSPNQPVATGIYSEFAMGPWNKHIDPDITQDFIKNRVLATPESEYRKAFEPLFRGESGGDADTLTRNFMQSIQNLPSRFENYYNRIR